MKMENNNNEIYFLKIKYSMKTVKKKEREDSDSSYESTSCTPANVSFNLPFLQY